MKPTALLLTGLLACTAAPTAAQTGTVRRTDAAVTVRLDGPRWLRVGFCGEQVARIQVSATEAFPTRPSLVVVACDAPEGWTTEEAGDTVVVRTAAAAVRVHRTDGGLVVTGADGRAALRAHAPAAFTAVSVSDGPAVAVAQTFRLTPGEGLFGLGQFQDGHLNWRGRSTLLAPSNTRKPIPFAVSSRGWGVLWDNASTSRFRDDAAGMTLSSEVADGTDYYVVASATPAEAIAGYRRLTGAAPMYPRWAYGFWQSKERYKTQEEVVEVVDEYRRRRVPLDAVVQDWQWWPDPDHLSGMEWDSTRYPDPAALVRDLRTRNAHLMVSVWPAVGPASPVHAALAAQGHLFPRPHWSPAHVYDAYSPEARATYFRFARKALTDNGVEGWWMDGSEPEFRSTDDRYLTRDRLVANGESALGSLARYATTYALVHAGGVYDGLREATPETRPYILSRSAFAGQQRYGATLWSGDLYASWQVFREQIPAGLNTSMAGYPYWTCDIGAFFTFTRFPDGLADPAYRELYTRWFQFGAFLPIFRSHGTDIPREIWRFGEPGAAAYDAIAAASRLRYRLLPYLYSEAARVERDGASLMRALPHDFPADARTYDIDDTYLFGPSLLVHPVTLAMQTAPAAPRASINADQILDPTGTRQGMELEFYRGTGLDSLVGRRLGESLQLQWTGGLPDEITNSPWSLRARGAFRVDTTGTYEMVATVSGGLRLHVGGEMVLDAWDNATLRTLRAPVSLRAGTAPFEIEYRQPTPRKAELTIEWVPPGWTETHPAKTWPTYLPAGTPWIDFWTGETRAGGAVDVAAAPLDRIPLYVRAGSVLPLGPDVQHANEDLGGPLEVRVYPGADGSYRLYDDAGDGHGYERGEHAHVPFVWDDGARTLTVGAREGTFPGLIPSRTLRVVVVRPGHGVGTEPAPEADIVVSYDGRPLTLPF